jgi:lysozyme family protein
MADFKVAASRTNRFEGGYQCYPDDNGNWTGGKKGLGFLIGTNRGITAPELMQFIGRLPSVNDMKNLTHADALLIYKKKFWDKIKGDEINSQELANQIYDMSVNAGVSAGIKLAQRIVGLPDNGKMNLELLNKLNGIV